MHRNQVTSTEPRYAQIEVSVSGNTLIIQSTGSGEPVTCNVNLDRYVQFNFTLKKDDFVHEGTHLYLVVDGMETNLGPVPEGFDILSLYKRLGSKKPSSIPQGEKTTGLGKIPQLPLYGFAVLALLAVGGISQYFLSQNTTGPSYRLQASSYEPVQPISPTFPKTENQTVSAQEWLAR
ncbi:hypothetical protein [Kiloniella sp.]|uniref:hypothetical protein n=1 Tax=Kiloniella sp. TaxID=1938587 RepID=UPI003B01B6E0